MDTEKPPVQVSTHEAYFRIVPVRGRWGRLERLSFTTPDDDARWLVEHAWSWVRGVQVEVRLSVYEADRQLFVGGVEILTVPQAWDIPNLGPVTPPAVEPLTIGTDILRAIPLGELAKEAIHKAKDLDVARTELQEDDEAFNRLRAAVSQSEEAKPRRGRPSNLTPELLAIVGNAYLRGGRTGVQAVQEALQAAGFEGSGRDGQVTRDQASKAVATARRKGYLAPAGRNTTPEGERT